MSQHGVPASPLSIGEGPRLVRAKYVGLLLIGIAATIYHLWFAYTFGIVMSKHLIVHLGIMMVVVILVSFDPAGLKGDSVVTRLDNAVVLPVEAVAAIATSTYLWVSYERIAIDQVGLYTDMDVLVGAVIILLVLDLSRRAFGLVLSMVGLVGLVYATYGTYFPGILHHQGVTLTRVITSSTVGFNGIYDIIVEVSATFIVVFIIFAGFLESYGALSYFITIGGKAGSYIRSGVTQMAVIASLSMGSVNGSAAANSATTGSFTIPLMKRHGIDSDTAASIEAVASSGGQIMPPIMGSAAFIMAEITGTSYLTIIGIAFLPAILFYGAVVFAVHLVTLKQGAGDMEPAELGVFATAEDDADVPTTVDDVSLGVGDGTVDMDTDRLDGASILKTFLDGLYLWIPLAALVYMLVFARFGALFAGFWAAIITIPTAFVQELIQADDLRSGVGRFAGNTIDACRLGIQNASTIALAAAVMGLFVGVLSLTGFSATLAQSLVDLAAGELAFLLVLAMITSILFGLGMPTVAAYIVAVILVAPALVNLGLQLETAHFFVFYFAILSAITPPVAITCIIATEIAGGNFWTVCKKSLLLGGPLFILPYVFVVNDELLFWTIPASITTFLVVLVGMMGLAATLVNYLEGRLGFPLQVGLLLASLGVMFAPVVPSPAIAASIRWPLTFALVAFFAWRLGFVPRPGTDADVRP